MPAAAIRRLRAASPPSSLLLCPRKRPPPPRHAPPPPPVPPSNQRCRPSAPSRRAGSGGGEGMKPRRWRKVSSAKTAAPREKVFVPSSKPYISFIGRKRSKTVISWHLRASDTNSNGNPIGTLSSASVAVEADYFCANGITFENTARGAAPGAEGMQAVALRLTGDKAMIYRCRILGSQDTLYDHTGRHFFYKCYIQGSIDFIFGVAKSLYQDCTLHAVAASYGAIAASQRNSSSEDSGFSFLNCRVTGSGMLYLGRAWGWYARVVYAYCQLEGIIIPEGWSDWGDASRRRNAIFGEFNCKGRGADQSRRESWARALTYNEARPFLDRHYIDGDQWLRL